MRLLLAGTPDERARLRAEVRGHRRTPYESGDDSPFTVVGEFASLAQARASGVDADGILVAGPHRVPRGDEEDFTEPLTAREIQVVELLAQGLPNKTIAARLGISDQTVKFHVASICGKLGAANRTDAVRRAARRGLIAL